MGNGLSNLSQWISHLIQEIHDYRYLRNRITIPGQFQYGRRKCVIDLNSESWHGPGTPSLEYFKEGKEHYLRKVADSAELSASRKDAVESISALCGPLNKVNPWLFHNTLILYDHDSCLVQFRNTKKIAEYNAEMSSVSSNSSNNNEQPLFLSSVYSLEPEAEEPTIYRWVKMALTVAMAVTIVYSVSITKGLNVKGFLGKQDWTVMNK